MSKPFTKQDGQFLKSVGVNAEPTSIAGRESRMTFDELVADIRKAAPGRVTVVTYAGLKFALECGIDVISDYAETYTLQAVIRDHGTPKQKQRLKEELIAGRWATAINMAASAPDTGGSK